MCFTVETTYDHKAMTAMARGIRKTIRKKRSKRSHIFGIIAAMLGILLILSASEISLRTVVTFLAIAAIDFALIWEDALNGYIAKRQILPGLEKTTVTFREEGYHSETGIGSSDFGYQTIQRLARCGNYLVFVFGSNHAQVYDLRNLTGGREEEFLAFLSERTGKQLEIV